MAAGTDPAARAAGSADSAGSAGSAGRWQEMLGSLAALLPEAVRCVLVDGPADAAGLFAGRLVAELAERGHPAWVTADPAVPSDLTVYLRAAPGGMAGGYGEREHVERADIEVDLHDPGWPVIRRVAAPLAARGPWYLTETRAFFGCRAATWDSRFGDDIPAYRAAVHEAGIRRGGTVLDVGCGTGRALPALRAAVGPGGRVVAVDLTPEMLAAAGPPSAAADAARIMADARRLPFADGCAAAVFAAGLVDHLPDTVAGLAELARVTRPGGLLVLFHPSGRAALAARRGRSLSPDEPLAEGPLRRLTAASGWQLSAYDDAPHRFFAVARRGPLSAPAGPGRA